MNIENNNVDIAAIVPELDLALEDFEIEDISDLNLHAPMSIACSSCSSSSACCS